MNKIHSSIFLLIKAALLNEKYNISLSDEEISEIFKIARKHGIVPLVYQGVYICGVKSKIISDYDSLVYSNLVYNQCQMYSIEQFKKEFTNNKIDFALLKGAVLKNLYSKPDFRSMGDIDILIKYDQYDKIRKILLSLGYAEGEETDHELQWGKASNIHIELHKRLIPTYNYDYYKYYGEGWSFFKASEDNSYMFQMSDEDTLVYIFTHLAKHYRDGGIGLRHFIDLYVYLNKYVDLDIKYIAKELQKLDLYNFYTNVLKTLKVWFDDEKGNLATDLITQKVFESGVYGNKDNRDTANAVRKNKSSSNIFMTKVIYIWNLVFMPFNLMKKKYYVLEKFPILLPVFWVRRWIEAILFKRKNIKRQEERLKKVNTEDIDNYEKNLSLVGLKFFDREIVKK